MFGLIRFHASEMVAYHGERGLVLFRKHLKRYLVGVESAEIYLPALLQAETLTAFERHLDELQFGQWHEPSLQSA